MIPPFIFGIIFLGIFAYFALSGRTSYEMIRKCCDEKVAMAKQAGMQRLGIDEGEIGLVEPMVIHGFDYKESLSSNTIYEV